MMLQTAEKDELYDLYRELVMDHARNPRHFGRMENATHTAQGINPLCGDKLTMYVRVDDQGCIKATGFEGSGCAISVASASLLTEIVPGLSVGDAEAVFGTVIRRLTGSDTDNRSVEDPMSDPLLSKLKALDGVREFPSRVKCATLAWHALHSALRGEPTPATTE